MIDPPREEVKGAVKKCFAAGVTPVMITGDHPNTAFAIAKELGIAKDISQTITGAELQSMSDAELKKRVLDLRVYARVSPEHKVRIVRAWKENGRITAMTGDGVNDAPSIKTADIGIGMGITGTDVTKSAADMVLADDNFATIVDAVEEGRKIFSNIQKTIQFLLSANIAEVISLLVATIVFAVTGSQAIFLLPIQILWVNLVTDSLPALSLGMEDAEKNVMSRPPSKSADNIFMGRVGVNIIYQGILQAAIVLGIFFFAEYGAWGGERATTLAFITLCLIQLFHCFNTKSIGRSILNKNIFKNKFMLISFAVGVVLTIGVALIPGVREIFHLNVLEWYQWLAAIGASLMIIPLTELGKLIVNAVTKNKI
jgi:Ca2+-transporting ATPase